MYKCSQTSNNGLFRCFRFLRGIFFWDWGKKHTILGGEWYPYLAPKMAKRVPWFERTFYIPKTYIMYNTNQLLFAIFVWSTFVFTILDMRHHCERKASNYSLWYAATQYIYGSQNVKNILKWIKDFSYNGTLFHNILIEILVTEMILWE